MRRISTQPLAKVPAAAVANTRNDMYVASEPIRFLMKDKEADLSKEDISFRSVVKIAVAIALGLGTMIGWKRIVASYLWAGRRRRTRRCGNYLRCRQLWVAGVDHPRSIVRGCRHHGCEQLRLQMSTLRNIALAWVLTLPAATLL